MYASPPALMLQNGDYLVPLYRGQHFLDKPILPFWIVAASYRVLGVSVFAERLPTALAGLATAALLFFWIRRRSGSRAGILAALVLAFSFLYVFTGMTFAADAFLTLSILAASIVLDRACRGDGSDAGWGALSGLCLAVAFGCKGLIGIVLPVGAVAAGLIADRQWPRRVWRRGAWALLVLVVVLAPYHWAMDRRLGVEFWDVFYWKNQFLRGASRIYMRPHRGVFYYVGVLAWGLFPWSFLLRRLADAPPALEPAARRAAVRPRVLVAARHEARGVRRDAPAGRGGARRRGGGRSAGGLARAVAEAALVARGRGRARRRRPLGAGLADARARRGRRPRRVSGNGSGRARARARRVRDPAAQRTGAARDGPRLRRPLPRRAARRRAVRPLRPPAGLGRARPGRVRLRLRRLRLRRGRHEPRVLLRLRLGARHRSGAGDPADDGARQGVRGHEVEHGAGARRAAAEVGSSRSLRDLRQLLVRPVRRVQEGLRDDAVARADRAASSRLGPPHPDPSPRRGRGESFSARASPVAAKRPPGRSRVCARRWRRERSLPPRIEKAAGRSPRTRKTQIGIRDRLEHADRGTPRSPSRSAGPRRRARRRRRSGRRRG